MIYCWFDVVGVMVFGIFVGWIIGGIETGIIGDNMLFGRGGGNDVGIGRGGIEMGFENCLGKVFGGIVFEVWVKLFCKIGCLEGGKDGDEE